MSKRLSVQVKKRRAANRQWVKCLVRAEHHLKGENGMAGQSPETTNVKTRKRGAVKASRSPGGEKVKATIHLSIESSQRLTVHAAMLGMDRSELVEQLIRDHLKRFVVSDRGGGSEPSEVQGAA